MSYFNNPNDRAIPAPQTISVPSVSINSVMRLVYVWMALGMLTTAGIAYFAATVPALETLRGSGFVMLLSIVVMFVTVIALSAGITSRRVTPSIAAAAFFVFSGIMGFSLSMTLEYFIANESQALVSAFGTTTILFGAMSMFGFTTNMDLSKWGTYLFMGLVGLIIAMLFNMFIGSSGLAFMISFIGVVLFTALTAYDTQKIKAMSMVPELQSDGDLALKFSILGALTLYLDFLNLFLFLLQLFAGGSRD